MHWFLYVIGAAALFSIGYIVGAHYPWSWIKQRIRQEAVTALHATTSGEVPPEAKTTPK